MTDVVGTPGEPVAGAILEMLDDVRSRSLTEQAAIFEAVHARLHDRLAEAEE